MKGPGPGHLQESGSLQVAASEATTASIAIRKPIGSALLRGADLLDAATVVLAGALLLGLVLVMVVGVVFRYILNDALSWSDEVAGFLMVWAAFAGSAIGLRRDGHPSITLLTSRLSGRARTFTDLSRQSLLGGYLIVLFVAGWAMVTAPALPHAVGLPISYSLPFAAVPVAAALMLVQWLRAVALSFRSKWVVLVVTMAILVGWLLVSFSQNPPPWLAGLPLPALAILIPILFALGLPIAVVLGLFSVIALALQGGIPLTIATQRLFSGVDNPAFLAIPAFMFTGTLMEATGMSLGLVAFASGLVGRFRGGLALADVVASVFFADTSGSAVADTAAIGSVMMPGMRNRGYRESFVAAHQAAAGSLGTLFPPSISMIIFATITSVSVIRLFQSSIVPGVMVALSYMAIAYVVARRENYPREAVQGCGQMLRTLIVAFPTLVAPVIILGGIIFGVFAPYEAGAAAVAYVFLAGLAMDPRRHPREYGRAILRAVQTTSMVMFIIANATILAWVMIGFQLPQGIAAAIGGVSQNSIVILLLVCLFLVALAIFLEPPAILVGVIPILVPLTQAVGVDPYHFGVLVMMSGAIGMLLPPVGITLLVSIGILGTRVEDAARAAIPYVLVLAFNVILVILFPVLTNWLPLAMQHGH